MKFVFCALALVATANAYSRPAVIPSNFHKPLISASAAITLVEKTLKAEWKEDMTLIAAEWSPLTCPNPEAPEFCYYKQPITDHPLNLGVSGKSNEWSWFITYAIPNSGKIAKYRKWEFLSFQVQTDGSVNSLGADN